MDEELVKVSDLPKDEELELVTERTTPSLGQSIGRAAAQGATLGFGDEINGGFQALLKGAMDDGPMSMKKLLADYEMIRNAERKDNKAAKDAHGLAYGGAEFASGLPMMLAIPGGASATVGRAAATGAGAGAASGLGHSNAETVGGMAGDTALGGVLGALLGTAGKGIGMGLNKAFNTSGRAEAIKAAELAKIQKVNGPLEDAEAAALQQHAVKEAAHAAAVDQAPKKVAASVAKVNAKKLLESQDDLAQQEGALAKWNVDKSTSFQPGPSPLKTDGPASDLEAMALKEAAGKFGEKLNLDELLSKIGEPPVAPPMKNIVPAETQLAEKIAEAQRELLAKAANRASWGSGAGSLVGLGGKGSAMGAGIGAAIGAGEVALKNPLARIPLMEGANALGRGVGQGAALAGNRLALSPEILEMLAKLQGPQE